MTSRNAESDNWGQLLSDFGIEDKIQEDVPRTEELKAVVPPEPTEHSTGQAKVPEKSNADAFGVGLIDSEKESPEDASKPKEKKSIFSRFPKINFFGTPPEVSLDSVMEGAKSPSLGGKAFTDNKLEKMPISQERIDRQKNHQEQESATADARSAVVSQIDVLASGGNAKEQMGKRSPKRAVSSMFDDPVPESEELRKCKDLIGEQAHRRETHGDTLHEDDGDSRRHGSRQRGRGYRKPQSEENEGRGRGARYRPSTEVDDLPESDFELIDDEVPTTRRHGQRGSRYSGDGYRDRERERAKDDLPQEEWSEIDAALQADTGRSESVQRGGRRQRYDNQRFDEERSDRRRRPERVDEPTMRREPLDREDGAFITNHGNIPSWDEAIHDTILGNIARHKGHSGGQSGRGRR
jgi:hypothetical protein